MTDQAERLIDQWEQLKAKRTHWDAHWQDISDVLLPRATGFITKEERGTKRTEHVFDATANLALDRFAAAFNSLLTPLGQKWHALKAGVKELDDDHSVKEFFQVLNDQLFNLRYSEAANFASSWHESYLQLGSFGSGVCFVDESSSNFGMRYKSQHLANIWYVLDSDGKPSTVFRRFTMTAYAARRKADWDGNLPEVISKAVNLWQDFEFLHVVQPNDDFDPGRADAQGMRLKSTYISCEGKKTLSVGGYSKMPYIISRYVVAPEEEYGRSPAMIVLPDIKMLNQMSKTDIRAVHKLVDPPLLLHDDGVMGSNGMQVDATPGALIYGGVDSMGNQLVRPLQTGARVDIAEEKMEGRRKTINDAFLVTLFQILVESPQMTATEALMRAQEKGALLGPAVARQQSESLGPLIAREISILQNQGLIPPLPEALVEAEGEYEIEYVSPITRAQRAEEALGWQRSLEALAPVLQIKPELLEIYDLEEVARIISDVNGMPPSTLRTRDEYAQIVEQMLADNQQTQAIDRAAPVAGALKDAAQAQALLSQAG